MISFSNITKKIWFRDRSTTWSKFLQLEQHQRSYTKCSWVFSIHWMQCGLIWQQSTIPSLLVCGHFWIKLHWLPCVPIFLSTRFNYNNTILKFILVLYNWPLYLLFISRIKCCIFFLTSITQLVHQVDRITCIGICKG